MASGRGEPSLAEVLLMLTTMAALHLLIVSRVKSLWDLAVTWGDNQSYLAIAAIIRTWHFSGGPIPHHFWGFPYAIAGVSKLLGIPDLTAMVVVSMLGSVAACVLVHRLYGGWVAAVFIFLVYEWLQWSLEGGSETPFVALLYASFLAARSSRWKSAALLASLSTTVRPLGILALVSYALVLAKRRSYGQLAAITLLGLAVGALYLALVWNVLGNPFTNIILYRKVSWDAQGWVVTYPFGALIPCFIDFIPSARWYTLVFFVIWPVVAVIGLVMIWLPRHRQRLWQYPAEPLFASMYTYFLLSFNYNAIIWFFSRYLLPVLPFLIFAMRDWIPRDRRVLWGGAILTAVMSAIAVVHFENLFGFRMP